MKVHLINKGLITEFLNEDPKCKKGISIWVKLMDHVDWNRLSDIDHTFTPPFILKEQHEVKFEIPSVNIILTCRYYFHTHRVHVIIKHIQVNEVQSH
jgi:mRNA-degrading endonuclease HigB of HigAB toxin-antitoxin module